jgi:aspartyl-tRNA(Asn)/glutamyl-tRNA(Gln) amidotransferase subunit B
MTWEAVIGIEVHAQLRTARKLFCADEVIFGDAPNTHVCPVCLGLPGALPATNPEAVRLAVRSALSLGCTVHPESVWARKNYFYPDLPKGYQITQFDRPIATDGTVVFDTDDGEKSVRIRRVHMEEDAGKSLHDRIPGSTAVDLNRAGTPLVEIVTEPDLHSPEDTRAFLSALKQTLEYVEVSDCNMEEGSLRADANISLRPAGSSGLGVKTEIKNVNSFSGIQRALEIEIERQRHVLDGGGTIQQQTLLWDDHKGEVRPMRSKEESHDYRYFPDPDLPPLRVAPEAIREAEKALPELPRARRYRLQNELGLAPYDAGVLTQSRVTADYFEDVSAQVGDAKVAANWMMGPVQALMNDRGYDAITLPVRPAQLADLIGLVLDGTVSEGGAKKVLAAIAEQGGEPRAFVQAMGLLQVRDEGQLLSWVDATLESHPAEADRCRGGEKKILGFLMGQVMKRSKGQADPRRVNELLVGRLDR